MIRAFAAVRVRFPSAHLLLLGDGPLMADLKALADGLGLQGCVHFLGYHPHSGPYLQAMNVFTLSSRSEGMPQSALEAYMSGIPVVATRVGGVPELVEHGKTGILVEPGDERGLAEGICRLLANPALARQMADAGRANVEAAFDIKRMIRDYHQHFLELLPAEYRA
jgi:glycosyltransferase involved in cell wall biosynthesis